MISKRFLLAVIAFTLMLPLSGCGCRRNNCCERSFAPPAGCCDRGTLPPGYPPGPHP
jgi:hypothetical protein